MKTYATELSRFIKQINQKFVFGIPGGPSIPLMNALKDEGISFITTANEASAGIMADMSYRLKGIPGVCHATFGPGATNLSTGVGGAYLDRSALLAFTTEIPDDMIHRVTQMNIKHQEVFKAVTKYTSRLNELNFKEELEKAYQISKQELPGPVHLGLPADLLHKETDRLNYKTGHKSPLKTVNITDELNGLIQKAKRPLLCIGHHLTRFCSREKITEWVTNNKIPVVLSPMAKGIFPEENDLYVGVLFHAGAEKIKHIYRSADLVIALGYDAVEFNYESWMPDVPLIHISTQTTDLPGSNVYNLIGDPFKTLKKLPLQKETFSWDYEEISKNKDALFEFLKNDHSRLGPQTVLQVLRQELDEDAIMTCDVGSHTHLIGQLWKTPAPSQQIMTNGWSSMGFGVPSAIGAKLYRPNQQVVSISGDGGFLMNCGELILARRLNLPIIFVVLSDQELNLIKIKQSRAQVQAYATNLYQGKYFDADRFLGIPVIRVETKMEMRKALCRGIAMEKAIIIEAQIDGREYHNKISVSY